MLVLARKEGERIWIGDQVAVMVLEARRGTVRLGIVAPTALPILRGELKERTHVGLDLGKAEEAGRDDHAQR